MGFWGVLASAIVCFASSNIDDALVLVVYFAAAAEGKDGFQRRHVWVGQLLGFSVIVLVSLVGAFAGSFLPTEYSGLLGFVPLFIGLWRTRHWCLKDKKDEGDSLELEAEVQSEAPAHGEAHVDVEMNAEASPKAQYHQQIDPVAEVNPDVSPKVDHQQADGDIEAAADASLTASYLHQTDVEGEDGAFISRKSGQKEQTDTDVKVQVETSQLPDCQQQPAAVEDARTSSAAASDNREQRTRLKAALTAVCSTHSLKMAAVTLANGGDNVAIYIPLLVTYNAGEVVVTIAVFYVLLVLWIFLAGAFVSFRVVANTIERYGKFIVPVALILLGLYILYSADVLSLVCSSC